MELSIDAVLQTASDKAFRERRLENTRLLLRGLAIGLTFGKQKS